MKTCLKGEVPELLKKYQEDNPEASWEQFKNDCQQGYKDVSEQLRRDQGNLCCYCEIETKQGFGNGLDDFRVEHFHPKSDASNSNQNWALDWQNMLGCCHGGSMQYVTDSKNRFIQKHLERHSDVLKSDCVWDDEIVNPLEIPPFPILFQAHRNDGSLSVHEDNCLQAGICVEKATNCLVPERLNLNSEKLKSLRKRTMDALNEQIRIGLSQNVPIEQIMLTVTKAQLSRNADGHWPAFFTTIRSFLGKTAEEHLEDIHFIG